MVHFIRSLEAHLEENGCWLDAASFALNGNVREIGSNEPISQKRLGELLFGCFDARTRHMEAIEGATAALHDLNSHAEVVMLTNLPDSYLEDRTANLRGHGMPYPVIANNGSKGPAVEALIDGSPHGAVFIDDSPNNIVSVAETCPDVHLIHFIPDTRFARHVEPIDAVALRTGDWAEARPFIRTLIGAPDDP